MCGIVGLLYKSPGGDIERGGVERGAQLGTWLVPMFECMAERGPDSAGLAVFGPAAPSGKRRFSLFVRQRDFDWQAWGMLLMDALGGESQLDIKENHAVLVTTVDSAALRDWLATQSDAPLIMSVGRRIDVYKDEGHPSEISARYRFGELKGTHCVGHTRMATESAVSPAHAHPFTAGEDFCLVHNGSLSNPYMLRRKLEAQGLHFETDNDTEAACRFIEWRLRSGDDLTTALATAFRELDGFYTLLIATADKLILVRDAFACKPAVVAETDDYVAISSEFRSLAHLPGIEAARIFEPLPEVVYSWSV